MKKSVKFICLLLSATILAGCGNNSQETTDEVFTVTWKNYDGSILEIDEGVKKGEYPEYNGEIPRHIKDEQYSYSFKGWSPSLRTVINDVTYVAQFTTATNTYQVTWLNYDGTVLEVDSQVKYGANPHYNGKTPSKPANEQYEFTFKGWSPELSAVVNNISYTAEFEEKLTKACVYFDLNGGNSPTAPASKLMESIVSSNFYFDLTKDNYNFRGWSYNGEKIFDEKGRALRNISIAEQMTFKAIFEQNVVLSITKNYKDCGEVKGAGTYNFNDQIDVEAIPNEGYKFEGWYYNNNLISTEKVYKYVMWNTDIELEARFSLITYYLTIQSGEATLGNVSISGKSYISNVAFKYASSISVVATSLTEEYRFIGWFDENGNKVDEKAVYSFTMPAHNYILVAHWETSDCELKIENNEECGKVSGAGLYHEDQLVSVSATPNDGYRFIGWYENNKLLSQYSEYSFRIPLKSSKYTIIAKFEAIIFNINYVLNDGVISGETRQYTVKDEVELVEPLKTGYTFICWVDENNEQKNKIEKGSIGNIVLTAVWSANAYKVTLNNDNPVRGSVDGEGFYDFDSYFEIKATPKDGYSFNYWQDLEGNKNYYSSLNKQMKNVDGYTFTAYWIINTYSISYNLNYGKINEDYSTKYTVEDEIILPTNVTKTGYTFAGWKLNNDFVTKIEKGTTGNLTLYAIWNANQHTVKVTSANEAMGTVKGGGTYSYDTDVSITATPNTGYKFDNWSGTLSSIYASVTFNVYKDHDIVANFSAISYKITYIMDEGTNSNENITSYNVTTDFAFKTPTKKGYSFKGWVNYNTNEPISKIEPGTTGDLILQAIWSINTYTITVKPVSKAYGYTSGSGEYEYQTKINIQAWANTGYTFNSFKLANGNTVSTKSSATYTVSNKNETIYAHYDLISYNISYDLDGGIMLTSNPSEYNIESNIELNNPVKSGYVFGGWFENETLVTKIEPGNYGDRRFVAHWTLGSYDLTVESNDELKGTVSGNGKFEYGSEVTVTATPEEGYMFKGWYSDSEYKKLLSEDTTFTFDMYPESTTIYAYFYDETEYNEFLIKQYAKPVSMDGDIYFGTYPQKVVSDIDLISILDTLTYTDSNGYYCYDDTFYVKQEVLTNPYSTKFSDGSAIVKGDMRWFSVDPIKWHIVATNDDNYFLTTKSILDYTRFSLIGEFERTDYQGNIAVAAEDNYKYSDLRNYLNTIFYETAFRYGESSIQVTEVDNSPESTLNDKNTRCCENTFDKVFELSAKEFNYQNLYKKDDRYIATTDYVRAVYYPDYKVHYYTRSPSGQYSTEDNHGIKCMMSSTYNSEYYEWLIYGRNDPATRLGVRPGINIVFNEE